MDDGSQETPTSAAGTPPADLTVLTAELAALRGALEESLRLGTGYRQVAADRAERISALVRENEDLRAAREQALSELAQAGTALREAGEDLQDARARLATEQELRASAVARAASLTEAAERAQHRARRSQDQLTALRRRRGVRAALRAADAVATLRRRAGRP